jgi:hypothetical protein
MRSACGLGLKHLEYLVIVMMHLMWIVGFGMPTQFRGANASVKTIEHMAHNVSQ